MHDPDEPSRKALALATAVVMLGVSVASRRVRKPISRDGLRIASPLLVKPLATWLTRRGII